MRRVLTATEMQQVDTYTIQKLGILPQVLMERAALAVADRLERLQMGKKIMVVCGNGNNGGDGLAAARILSARGYQVCVYLCEQRKGKGSEGYLYQLSQLSMYPISVRDTLEDEGFDCVVDAVFGVGLSREITGAYCEVIQKINQMSGVKLAVDCPSGVDCNTGAIQGIAVHADETVTFGAMKLGLILYPGAEHAGKVQVADIGFPERAYEEAGVQKRWMTGQEDLFRLPPRLPYSNKGTYGKVAVVAGSKNMCGAAVMAAKACYAVGAGLVKVITCEENRNIIQTMVPEAVLATYESETLSHIPQELAWADVILAGPGLSTGAAAQELVRMSIQAGKPLVLDADALNILSRHPELWMELSTCQVIITPHLGEMERLTGMQMKDIQKDLLQTCQDFAKKYGIVCVMKDARTAISDGEQCTINTSGNAGMAKGGSGDVLAGILAGLLPQQKDIYGAAVSGVYLHGAAGDAAARRKGKYSMSPFDIIENISDITQQVEDRQR